MSLFTCVTTDLGAVVPDGHGAHPQELPLLPAAQQSPGGRTATLESRVQLGLLERPLFVNQRDSVSDTHTSQNNLMTRVKAVAASHSITSLGRIIVAF